MNILIFIGQSTSLLIYNKVFYHLNKFGNLIGFTLKPIFANKHRWQKTFLISKVAKNNQKINQNLTNLLVKRSLNPRSKKIKFLVAFELSNKLEALFMNYFSLILT
jgi:hypothetical protein